VIEDGQKEENHADHGLRSLPAHLRTQPGPPARQTHPAPRRSPDLGEARGLQPGHAGRHWAPVPGSGQQAIVDRIAERTAAFDGDVLLLQGDSHVFTADTPLGLDNFTRIVVHGETLPFEYLRLTIDPRSHDQFSWERVMVPGP
jgi:hypothetical protein